jgi:hypothetical protein
MESCRDLDLSGEVARERELPSCRAVFSLDLVLRPATDLGGVRRILLINSDEVFGCV